MRTLIDLRQRCHIGRDLAGALACGRFAAAVRMARTAARCPGQSEKIVSRRFGYLWLCNPKVASRSILAVLRQIEPDVHVIEGKSAAEVCAMHPGASGYLSFAFIRHPFARALSLYAEMRYFGERFEGTHRAAKLARQLRLDRSFFGLAEVGSFDGYCEWLNTPYGSDAFADGHFLSQHLQIRLADDRLPDFVGRLETIDEDFGRLAARAGLPVARLPRLNTVLGWEAASLPALAAARAELAQSLNARNKALLSKRYAADMELFAAVSEGRCGRRAIAAGGS